MIIYLNPTNNNLVKDIEELYKRILAKLLLELTNLYNYFLKAKSNTLPFYYSKFNFYI